jgi:hypothetical protein
MLASPGAKWEGASMCVPVWVLMNITSELYPWDSNLDHGINDGLGEPGNTLIEGVILIVRSSTFMIVLADTTLLIILLENG